MKANLSKYQACLLGGAIGDALGAGIEFLSLQQILNNYGEKGVKDYVEFEDGSGAFTDDTQMTLFTAEALLRAYLRENSKGISGALNTIAHHSYLRWLHTQNGNLNKIGLEKNHLLNGWLIKEQGLFQRRAPGNTCLSALNSGRTGTIENPINNSKGCGTIMRMAPVGLMYFGENEMSFRIACELSAITHGHPTGYLSAGFFASVISDLAVQIDLETAIQNALEILTAQQNHRETLNAVLQALELHKNLNASPTPKTIEKLGGAWVAEEALAISLFAALVYQNDFEKGVLLSINHSGDSDSTGSITGNLLGLINGSRSIPKNWIENLRERRIVNQMAVDLFLGIRGEPPFFDDDWSQKYPPG